MRPSKVRAAKRIPIGTAVVNGWAGKSNPHRAGVYLGMSGKWALVVTGDGKVGKFPRESLVPSSFQVFLAEVAAKAAAEVGDDARSYTSAILWPAFHDDETRGKIWRGEYAPPTFEEWKEQQP